MLAYVRRPAEARAIATHALDLAVQQQGTRNVDLLPYIILNNIRVELALGNPSGVLDLLEKYGAERGMPSFKYMQLDPTFASLQGNPRFEQLSGR